MEKDLYLIILEFRDGENQYQELRVSESENKEEVKERVDTYLRDYFGQDTEVETSFVGREEKKIYTAPKGYPAVKVVGITKIEGLEELTRKIGYIPEE